jgi:group I intron endonuclease
MNKKAKIGIYKIISPSEKIYIGESINIEKRFKAYNSLCCKKQIKLYNSLLKYGVENHTFEIIEECLQEDLNCRERYWQDYYDVLNGGLNCRLTECGVLKNIMSDETRQKIKDNHADTSGENCYWFGKKLTQEHKNKISNTRKENGISKGENNPMFGVSLVSYWKDKNLSEETKNKISQKLKGHEGTNNCEVLLTEIGIFCKSIKEASDMLDINRRNLNHHLNTNSTKYPAIKI